MSEQPRAIVDRAVARLRTDALLPSTEGGGAVTRVLAVSIRPFSYVARVEIASPVARRRVFVKIPRLKPGKPDVRTSRLEQEAAAARMLASVFTDEPGLGVAQPLALDPEIPALVWAEVEGVTLEAMARRLAAGVPGRKAMARLEGACHGAGRWLRTLQAATVDHERELSLNEMIAYVDVRLTRICELAPQGLGAQWRAKVSAVFNDARLTGSELRLAAIHGDFSLSNVLYDGSRLVAIDFSRFGRGSIYYDVSRLYHQLGLLLHKPWFRPPTVARLRRALLDGYDPALRPDDPAFRLFVIQHLLCHWQGLLRRSATVSWPVRGFHRWIGHRHRGELERLIQPAARGTRSSEEWATT